MDELQSICPLRLIGRVRLWTSLCVAALAVVVAYGGAAYVGARHTDAAAALAAEAVSAVDEARRADAMTWAPDELLQAESTLRKAAADERIQHARLWPLPNLDDVNTGYRRATATARDAVRLATDRRDTARTASDEAIAVAADAVTRSASLAGTIHLGGDRLILLSRARVSLDEARVYNRNGDYGSATLTAARSLSLADRVSSLAAEVAARYADEEIVRVWQQWKTEIIAWSRREGRAAIFVSKEAHRVTLYVNGEPARTYRADMGFNWVADKRHAGDGATPEGRYRIVARKTGGDTMYHKALLLDYPNRDDQTEFTRARRTGELPSSAAIGGLIEIHGEGGRGRDWTRGCVALTNTDMDDLFARIEIGTPVTVVGSDESGLLAATGSLAALARQGLK